MAEMTNKSASTDGSSRTPGHLDRDAMLDMARARKSWDVIVVGGGATGLGTAVDAASRGLSTLLLERGDFAEGTSSRSTKLAHGGVRYLRQGQIGLVRRALHERARMLTNAPHLVRMKRFLVPCGSIAETLFYGAGLKLYDLLSLGRGLERSRIMKRAEVLEEQPGIKPSMAKGGVAYYDGQFDDARFALGLAQTCAREGGALLNYCEVESLIKQDGKVQGVMSKDLESGEVLAIHGRCVVNATGVFVDSIRRMDSPGTDAVVRASQGVHLVLDASFLPGDSAVMVPKTDDGRVLFAIPWQGRVLVGTTDTPTDSIDREPGPLDEEIAYLLSHAARYLRRAPAASDVRSIFVGLRPLIGNPKKPTKSVPREHLIKLSASGLLTITGGKWTTYRRMAQEVVDKAIDLLGEAHRPCVTQSLKLFAADDSGRGPFREYGTDREVLQQMIEAEEHASERIHPDLPYLQGQVKWAARHEMARTVEDVLARRTRALLLDAKASSQAAPLVASLLGTELGRDADWQARQVEQFNLLARQYLLPEDGLT